ncbi:MAG: TraB/GumN family protein, partial [Bacteroidetes bacterium]|nr:TraB/GumN family protein [Bacteroidota bacterium]
TYFLNYAKKNYEAKRYGLILWDHGGGAVSGFGYDENDPDEEETLTIDNTEKETMEIQTIMNAWKNGDIETLKKILDVDYTSNQKLNKRIKEELIIKRNKEMADNIEKILANEDKNYFIIVGAGHLVSEKNIIELLEKTGKYKIKRY